MMMILTSSGWVTFASSSRNNPQPDGLVVDLIEDDEPFTDDDARPLLQAGTNSTLRRRG
jgi:hypothetical protein